MTSSLRRNSSNWSTNPSLESGESDTSQPQRFPSAITERRAKAFWDWNEVAGTLHADAFLTGLPAYRHMQG